MSSLLFDPLCEEARRTLEDLSFGLPGERFWVAYLIARECVSSDGAKLKITEHGNRVLDAMAKADRRMAERRALLLGRG